MGRTGKLRCSFLLCIVIVSIVSVVHAEESAGLAQTKGDIESSWIGGFGQANIPEGNYRPFLLIWHLGVDLSRYFSGLEKQAGSLSAFLEPQVNISDCPTRDMEFGVGVGLQYRYPFARNLAGYLMGSWGLHYMTLITERQQNGPIFANTAGCGLYYFLREDRAIHFGYRFRHLSNAGLSAPNGGLDAHLLTLGYSVFY